MEMNPILEKLPHHLMSLVIDQPYNAYTDQDHAVWRYVMRQNVRYLSQVAHGSYVEGLKKTGISVDRIPHMYGMNRILKEIGWAAVAVDGFIPPSAFMEFQAYNVLVIAADIRPIDQIEYTPAPDIIHEAAGHAPIIADQEYAEYLRRFGWIGSKAFSSARDYEMYEAIRHLSILKADPYTSREEIALAERTLSEAESIAGPPSEMARIRNLHWWTVEYGLIGEIDRPKIYGAGLLSSIGESYSSLQPEVKKLPYALEAVNYNFDITTRQPQLFVTPDFEHLSKVLDEYANTMAIRKGGLDGILKAIDSSNVASCVYSSGLQVSGTFSEVIIDQDQPVYLRTIGPTSLSFEDHELEGHGRDHHREGFGSPIGKLRASAVPMEEMDPGDMEEINIQPGEWAELEFESGIRLEGHLLRVLRKNGKNILMTFSDCRVTHREKVLFEPSWGLYDMALGERIISAFNGPADTVAFGLKYPVPKEKTHKIMHSAEATRLHHLYQVVREQREHKNNADLVSIFGEIRSSYPDEWLLPMEILEHCSRHPDYRVLEGEVREYLEKKALSEDGLPNLIRNGFESIYGLEEQ